ncbi:hypothetical protein [Chitinophaga sp.]|uniref:hypothetical protein n=1 Tax=Chitinophaga sp. TaxID=1869181 RepID=UPI002F937B73
MRTSPVLYAQYPLKRTGKLVTCFGADVLLADLKAFTPARQATHIYTHLLTNVTPPAMQRFIMKLHQQFPGIKILLWGPQAWQLTTPLP